MPLLLLRNRGICARDVSMAAVGAPLAYSTSDELAAVIELVGGMRLAEGGDGGLSGSCRAGAIPRRRLGSLFATCCSQILVEGTLERDAVLS